jgi:hypothetical protein
MVTGAWHRRLYTGVVGVVELGVDDLEFLAVADGGDELFERLRIDVGINAGVLMVTQEESDS